MHPSQGCCWENWSTWTSLEQCTLNFGPDNNKVKQLWMKSQVYSLGWQVGCGTDHQGNMHMFGLQMHWYKHHQCHFPMVSLSLSLTHSHTHTQSTERLRSPSFSEESWTKKSNKAFGKSWLVYWSYVVFIMALDMLNRYCTLHKCCDPPFTPYWFSLSHSRTPPSPLPSPCFIFIWLFSSI